MANVTSTVRIGTRVLRVIGESGFRRRYVFEQMDFWLEHVRQARRERLPHAVVGVQQALPFEL